MTVIHSSLFYIIKCFPSQRNIICRVFKENEEFRILCEDYLRCLDAKKRWGQSLAEEAPYRRLEYSDLLQELEMEILRVLNELG